MKMTRHYVVIFAVVLFLGCGSGDGVSLVPVTGNVTLDGQPLAEARVIFHPADGGRPSNAVTDSDGNYNLQYTEDRIGALPGKHSVNISTFVEADPDSSDPLIKTGQRESLPPKYNTQTTLQAELDTGSSEKVDFELTSAAGR